MIFIGSQNTSDQMHEINESWSSVMYIDIYLMSLLSKTSRMLIYQFGIRLFCLDQHNWHTD
jgi:hypothetical protein